MASLLIHINFFVFLVIFAIALNDLKQKYIKKTSNLRRNNLFELFPNPCKDLTTVSFYLSFEKFVEIKIFDLRGNEISTLVSNYVLKGQKELDFDFSFLSSGTYIISIKTKDFQKDILFSKM